MQSLTLYGQLRVETGLRIASLFLFAWNLFPDSSSHECCGAEEVARDAKHEATVDFDRDIRPILSDACFQCHGPDEQQRQADLRLDLQANMLAHASGTPVVTPHLPEKSEIYRRIISADDGERMPPQGSGKHLSAQQIQLIGDWIKQGAVWKDHWAFVPPKRPKLPVANGWVTEDPVDTFVRSRLRDSRLRPTGQADRATLIRRITLDLTGLPPTPEEADAYLADHRPDAYERLVDRLMASPRFGERMALPWLDAARYADTSGYQNDGPRQMWRWRDWVIDALNQNMTFDQFTIQQLAGDMLPDATLDQMIASGFNRNHRGNAEGGIIPEEYAVEYVVDRVETTSTVWLGLTLACARCHDHKFDPISQRDFYRFYDFFNNVPEFGRAIKEGNSPPWIKAPTQLQFAKLKTLDRQLEAARSQFAAMTPFIAQAQAAWENTLSPEDFGDWTPARDLVARFSLDGTFSPAGTAVGAGAKTHAAPIPPSFTEGKLGQSASFDGDAFINAGDVANFGYFDKFSIAAWIRPSGQKVNSVSSGETRHIVSRMTDAARAAGYSIAWQSGHLRVNLVKRWLDDAIRVRTTRPLPADRWFHICITYDGTRRADGISLYVDGRRVPLTIELDLLNQSFDVDEPLRIGGGGGEEGRFSGLIDEVLIYGRELTADQAIVLSEVKTPWAIARRRPATRSAAARAKLRAFFLAQHAPPELQRASRRLVEARDARHAFWEQVPTVMVMKEGDSQQTFVLRRGQYDQPGDPVSAGIPGCLPPPMEESGIDRLTLARWIVDPANPLTSRVAVNRYWQALFGSGLVETPEDFGTQGARPTHPQLLDWLATEFTGNGWDTKQLLRTIVNSAPYRRSSRATVDALDRDPRNRLLARGPRFRLRAEFIRDQALAASELLVQQVGGPSVRPYQPAGWWKEIASVTDYRQATGAGLYRRGLYTYWKRTVAPPAMMTFDASARETCVVRQARTNTPLQALTLMNDVAFLECSRALAQRALTEGGDSPARRIASVFRHVLTRQPKDFELQTLEQGLHDYRARFRADPTAAGELIQTGEFPVPGSTDPVELAAYMVVASIILNLDETVSRE